MTTEVKLPDLGDGIESGDVLEVFVDVGDVIQKGQDIIEMETDKATVTVPASIGGKVVKVLVSEGDTVPIDGTLLEVEAADGAESSPPPAAPAPQASEPAAPPPAAQAPATPAPEPAQPTPPPNAPPVAADPPPAAPPAPVAPPSPVAPAAAPSPAPSQQLTRR